VITVRSIINCGNDIRCFSREVTCTADPVAEPCCGDGVCESYESGCSCSEDCGAPLAFEAPGESCQDGIDNDCDGSIDEVYELVTYPYDSTGDGVDNKTIVQANIVEAGECTDGEILEDGRLCFEDYATAEDVCSEAGVGSAASARGYWWGDCGGPEICAESDTDTSGLSCSGYVDDCNGDRYRSGLYYWDSSGEAVGSADVATTTFLYDEHGSGIDPGYNLISKCDL